MTHIRFLKQGRAAYTEAENQLNWKLDGLDRILIRDDDQVLVGDLHFEARPKAVWNGQILGKKVRVYPEGATFD